MPGELAALDGAAARRWAGAAVAGLDTARERLDALNVYPVPDGDTGTNLHLTLLQGLHDLGDLDDDAPLGRVSDVFARGCLLGARGNSGIITAQLLRGWADVLAAHSEAGADVAREAFARADAEAWEAVADPVEGTILSVSRAAAAAAHDTAARTLAGVVAAAVDAAREALARTPEQLDVLAAAGVVDAGGAGLVVLLEALRGVVEGREVDVDVVGASVPTSAGAVPAVAHRCGERAAGTTHGYEVMYLLDAADDAVPGLRADLGRLGGSLVVVGGGGLWNVHVHTDEPGAAVEAGIAAGRPHRVRITHLDDEVRRAAAAPGRCGVVAVAAGPGLAALFEEAGAVAVRPGSGHRVSTAEVLQAVRSTGAASVVVLPNDPDTLAVAQAAAGVARGEGLTVTVLPTRAQVQGLAAVAVHDPDVDPADDVVAMSSAAAGARHGAVTVAVREAITSAGRCRAGDVLGVVDGDFAVVGDDLLAVAREVVDRLLSSGGELVTLVVGADAPDGLVRGVRDALHAARPDVDVQVLDGGQERYPLLVGVE